MTDKELTLRTPTVLGARDVPKLRVWIDEQWKTDGLFHNAAALARLRRNSAFPALVQEAISSIDVMKRADIYARWERNTMREAQLWWVSTEMEDLLIAAAKNVPDDVTVADVPQPDPCGFAVFQRPLLGTASDTGSPIDVQAIAWGPNILPPMDDDQAIRNTWNPGYSISSYSMIDLDAGLTPEQLTANAGGLGELMDAQGHIRNEKYPHQVVAHGQLWTTCGRSDWINGTVVTDRALYGYDADADQLAVSAIEDRKLLVAFWTLVHQRGIAETTIERPPRPEVRRVQRAGLPKTAADVRVVRLRNLERSAPGDGPSIPRQWSHRWLVNGHWRNQPFGPGRSERRLVWIHPYIKGPEDAEFSRPETVRAWVR